jgi:hypothetical protein
LIKVQARRSDEKLGLVLITWLRRSAIEGFLAPVALVAIILIVVDAALPQLEMFLTGGQVPVPTSSLKLLLVGAIVVSFSVAPSITLSWFPLRAWILFVTYLVIDIPHLMTQDLTMFQVLSEYYGYYSLILILPAACVLALRIEEASVVRVIKMIFMVCAILGIAQFAFDSPILYTESADGRFSIIAWQFFATGGIRAFSLFVYSVNFGLFCSMVGGIGLFSFLQRKNGLDALLFVTAAICCYITLTRVVFLVFCATVFGVVALRFGKTTKAVRSAALLSFLTGIAVAYGGAIGLLGGGNGIGDTLSLLQRLEQVAYYWGVFSSGTVAQKLLGFGIVQDVNFNKMSIYPIDNLFMALLLHIGLFGLLAFLFLVWSVWLAITKETRQRMTSLRAGVCGLWVSFGAISLFDISTMVFAVSVMLLIITRPNLKQTEIVDSGNRTRNANGGAAALA